MTKFLLVLLALLAPAFARAQSGPGPLQPWGVSYPNIYFDLGGIALPSTVTGGYKGVGTINAKGLYVQGVPVLAYLNMSAGLDSISPTVGSILYRNSSGWQALTPGTNGFVLYSGGPGAIPYWGSNGAAGGTVTSVGSGSGLTGGPITGSGTLSIAAGGVTSSMLAAGAASGNIGSLTGSCSGTLPSTSCIVPYSGGVTGKLQWDARDYGVVCNGSTNNATANSAAVSAASAGGGGIIEYPVGTCNWSGTFVINASNVTIEGQGEGATVWQETGTTGDIFSFGTTGNPNNVVLRNGTIQASAAMSSGDALHVTNVHEFSADRLLFGSNLYVNVGFDGGAGQFLYHLDNFQINSGLVGIDVGASGADVQNLYVSNGAIYNTTGEGILLYYSGGDYFSHIDIGSCAKGVMTYPAAGQNVSSSWFDDVGADTCSDTGWLFTTNGGLVSQIQTSGLWASNTGTGTHSGGVEIQAASGSIDDISFVAPIISHNYGNGIDLVSGNHISMTNAKIWNNSTGGAGVYHGVNIYAGVSNFSITGGFFGKGGFYGGEANNQECGINVNAGASDYYAIVGVNSYGNALNGVCNNGTGTHQIVSQVP